MWPSLAVQYTGREGIVTPYHLLELQSPWTCRTACPKPRKIEPNHLLATSTPKPLAKPVSGTPMPLFWR